MQCGEFVTCIHCSQSQRERATCTPPWTDFSSPTLPSLSLSLGFFLLCFGTAPDAGRGQIIDHTHSRRAHRKDGGTKHRRFCILAQPHTHETHGTTCLTSCLLNYQVLRTKFQVSSLLDTTAQLMIVSMFACVNRCAPNTPPAHQSDYVEETAAVPPQG